MSDLFKLMVFLIVLASIMLISYWGYKKLNQRIVASESAASLIFYSLLLIAGNLLLLFGGIYILVKAYDFLSSSGR